MTTLNRLSLLIIATVLVLFGITLSYRYSFVVFLVFTPLWIGILIPAIFAYFRKQKAS